MVIGGAREIAANSTSAAADWLGSADLASPGQSEVREIAIPFTSAASDWLGSADLASTGQSEAAAFFKIKHKFGVRGDSNPRLID